MVEEKEAIKRLTRLPHIDENRAKKLYKNDISSYEDLLEEGVGGLTALEDVSINNVAEILEKAEEFETKEDGLLVKNLIKDVDELSIEPKDTERFEDQNFQEIAEKLREKDGPSKKQSSDDGVAEGILKGVEELEGVQEKEEDLEEGIADEILKGIEKLEEEPQVGIAERLVKGVKDLTSPSEEHGDDLEEAIAEDSQRGLKELSGSSKNNGIEEHLEMKDPEKRKSSIESLKSPLKRTSERDTSDKGRDDEEKHTPKKIIRIPKNITEEKGISRPSITEALPVVTSFLIPVFIMIFVGIEFIIALLSYPVVTPSSSLYYLTPVTYFRSFWITTLTLSFLAALGIFIPTFIGYDFSSERGIELDKRMISISVFFSSIVCLSLSLHIYHRQIEVGGILALSLLILLLFGLVTQFELLRRKNTIFPKPIKMKECPECSEKVPIDIDLCPVCSTILANPKELSKGYKKGVVEKELEEEDKDENEDEDSSQVDEQDEQNIHEEKSKEKDAESWMANIEKILKFGGG